MCIIQDHIGKVRPVTCSACENGVNGVEMLKGMTIFCGAVYDGSNGSECPGDEGYIQRGYMQDKDRQLLCR